MKKNYLKKYKYTKKLLNYSNASKCNSFHLWVLGRIRDVE